MFIKRFRDSRIVCLCGSMKHKELFLEVELKLSLEGIVVLSCSFVLASNEITKTEEQKLKDLHLTKIELCDTVYVLNVGGYIGESARREIDYALQLKKLVLYLEPEKVSGWKII